MSISVDGIWRAEDELGLVPPDDGAPMPFDNGAPMPEPVSPMGNTLTPTRLDEFPDSTPPPPLLDRLDPEAHTILFGAGGIGKGTVTSAWSVGLVTGGHTVLILDYERHPNEWRRRIARLSDTGLSSTPTPGS